MRTTVTLDPDVEALLKAAMHERDMGFKEVINEAIRAGLATRNPKPFRQRTFAMGFRPEVNYDKALELASAIEAQELVHKQALGK